jgi:hypothetical protein
MSKTAKAVPAETAIRDEDTAILVSFELIPAAVESDSPPGFPR